MSQNRDQNLARRILETRDRGGYTLGSIFRWNVRGYAVLVVYFGLVIAITAYLSYWPVCMAAIGAVSGCLLRDVGWIRGSNKGWGFTVKVIDWEKVQKIADGEPSSEV